MPVLVVDGAVGSAVPDPPAVQGNLPRKVRVEPIEAELEVIDTRLKLGAQLADDTALGILGVSYRDLPDQFFGFLLAEPGVKGQLRRVLEH